MSDHTSPPQDPKSPVITMVLNWVQVTPAPISLRVSLLTLGLGLTLFFGTGIYAAVTHTHWAISIAGRMPTVICTWG